jgi:hypothetical protein
MIYQNPFSWFCDRSETAALFYEFKCHHKNNANNYYKNLLHLQRSSDVFNHSKAANKRFFKYTD